MLLKIILRVNKILDLKRGDCNFNMLLKAVEASANLWR